MKAVSPYTRRMSDAKLMTAEELLREQPPHKRSELIRGRLVVREPADGRHGAVANEIAYQLTGHVKAGSLSRVYTAETGFKIASEPDTVRAPDVAFIRKERLPETEPTGYPAYAPDLVVEVLGADGDESQLRGGESLDGEDVVPGISLPLEQLW